MPYDGRFPPTAIDFWEAPIGPDPDYDPKKDPDAVKEGGGDYGVNEPGYYLDDGSFVYVKGEFCARAVPFIIVLALIIIIISICQIHLISSIVRFRFSVAWQKYMVFIHQVG